MIKKDLEGTIRLSRVMDSHADDCIRMEIEDKLSHSRPIDIKMSLAEFAEFASFRGASITFDFRPVTAEKIGLKCETMWLHCPKVVSYSNKEAQLSEVKKEAAKYEADGWEIFGDGTSSQQPGAEHKFTMRRWIEPDASDEVPADE